MESKVAVFWIVIIAWFVMSATAAAS